MRFFVLIFLFATLATIESAPPTHPDQKNSSTGSVGPINIKNPGKREKSARKPSPKSSSSENDSSSKNQLSSSDGSYAPMTFDGHNSERGVFNFDFEDASLQQLPPQLMVPKDSEFARKRGKKTNEKGKPPMIQTRGSTSKQGESSQTQPKTPTTQSDTSSDIFQMSPELARQTTEKTTTNDRPQRPRLERGRPLRRPTSATGLKHIEENENEPSNNA